MSERKYANDVSHIGYMLDVGKDKMGDVVSRYKTDAFPFPVRIVREKFYRLLIKVYEEWKES
jgi:hypothetical protein